MGLWFVSQDTSPKYDNSIESNVSGHLKWRCPSINIFQALCLSTPQVCSCLCCALYEVDGAQNRNHHLTYDYGNECDYVLLSFWLKLSFCSLSACHLCLLV